MQGSASLPCEEVKYSNQNIYTWFRPEVFQFALIFIFVLISLSEIVTFLCWGVSVRSYFQLLNPFECCFMHNWVAPNNFTGLSLMNVWYQCVLDILFLWLRLWVMFYLLLYLHYELLLLEPWFYKDSWLCSSIMWLVVLKTFYIF